MIRSLYAAFAALLDTLLPSRATERAIRGLTQETLSELALAHETLPYHEPSIRALVWEIKYRKNTHALALAGAFLAERALAHAEESLHVPVLVPVPMHISKRKIRGYNQTELICEAMLREAPLSFTYIKDALVRVRNTPPQQGLPRHRRLKNMLGAIEAVKPEVIEGRYCLVIDDVATTGATTHETKRALLEAGAQEVHILTLSHS